MSTLLSYKTYGSMPNCPVKEKLNAVVEVSSTSTLYKIVIHIIQNFSPATAAEFTWPTKQMAAQKERPTVTGISKLHEVCCVFQRHPTGHRLL